MIENIVKVPFSMRPSFEKYDGPLIETPNALYFHEKLWELESLDRNIHFESKIAKEEKLVSKVCKRLGIKERSNIVDLALCMNEDIAIMHKGRLEAIMFAFASSWNPGDKEGMTLEELHAPVGDGDQLRKMSSKIFELMTKECYHRHTWGLSTLYTLSNHSEYEKPKAFRLDDYFFRTEHEVTVPIEEDETAAFLVKVEMKRLTDLNYKYIILVRDSINSMNDEVLDYKNLREAKEFFRSYWQ